MNLHLLNKLHRKDNSQQIITNPSISKSQLDEQIHECSPNIEQYNAKIKRHIMKHHKLIKDQSYSLYLTNKGNNSGRVSTTNTSSNQLNKRNLTSNSRISEDKQNNLEINKPSIGITSDKCHSNINEERDDNTSCKPNNNNRLWVTDESSENEPLKPIGTSSKVNLSQDALKKLYIAYGSKIYTNAKTIVERIRSSKTMEK